MVDSVKYHPISLTNGIWERLTKRMQEDKEICWNNVVVAVTKANPSILRFSYKGETHSIAQFRGSNPFPSPLPESCYPIMDTYIAKRTKLDTDYEVFKSCFGSLVPHLRSSQDLRNILPDTYINRTGFISVVPRTMAIEDMSFQNMTPFNQYREIILPMFDWYLGMELII